MTDVIVIGAGPSLPGPTGTMIVCRRWLPIWSATTSPLSTQTAVAVPT